MCALSVAFGRGCEVNPEPLGIGLPVARRLASAMGGELIYTYEGGHSHFIVTLPATPGDASGEAMEEEK